MKFLKILMALVFISGCAPFALADFVVMYDKSTKEVVNYSEKESDFIIAPEDVSKFEFQNVSGGIKEYTDQAALSDYKISNKKLVLNVKKINDKEKEKTDEALRQAEFDAVDRRARKAAYEQLKADGFEFKSINDDTFK